MTAAESSDAQEPQWRHAADLAARRLAAERAAADPTYYAKCPRGIRMLADHIRAGGEG
ncbi:hypothetical protein [Mycobacterium sp. 23]|uniref:hypothetical protein n=1 Tax=Mycobacterium sp. 23 TaxID=3400424 RepID=UPI003AB103B6